MRFSTGLFQWSRFFQTASDLRYKVVVRQSEQSDPLRALRTGVSGLRNRLAGTAVGSRGCPSSDDLRLVRRFVKGGSGSSGLEFKRPATDAASVGWRWLHA